MRAHVRIGTEVVDGLRGIAILLVLCYHTWLFSWYTPVARPFGISLPVDVLPRVGYLGVDLFFAISGFCLAVPLARDVVDGVPQRGWRDFYLARALKIVPSYLIALAATPGHTGFRRGIVAHLFFAQSFFIDPFGQVNSVLWSVAIEVQFYLIFPLVALAFRRAPVLATLGALELAYVFRARGFDCCLRYETVYRELPAYLDVFVCGMAAALALFWLRRHAPWLERRAWPGTLVAVAAAYAGWQLALAANGVAYVPGGPQAWDRLGRTWLAVDVAVFIVAASLGLRALRAALACPPLVWLSLISYNLYLWHTLLLIWLWHHDVLGAVTPDPHDDAAWKLRFIAVGWSASLAVAAALTYFVERPLLGLRRQHGFAFDWRSLRRRRERPPGGRERARERRA